MSLDSVHQLQALNRIMKEQFHIYELLRAKPEIHDDLHAFDGLDSVHHQMDEEPLWRSIHLCLWRCAAAIS